MSQPTNDPLGIPLTDGPLSVGYQHVPSIMPAWWNRRIPPLTYWYIEQMLFDPQVRLALAFRKAPLRKATIVIKAADPEVRQYVVTTIQRMWRNGLRKILRGFEYGYAAAEVLWRYEKGQICYYGLKDFHAIDARPLTWEGSLAGIRLRNNQGSFTYTGWSAGQNDANENHLPARRQGIVDLLGSRAIWYTHDAAYGNWFGSSVLYGAQRPFDEKCSKDGAEDSRRLWYHKYAFRGPTIKYPVKTYAVTGPGGDPVNAQLLSARDLAREIGENARAGASLTFPNTYDPQTLKPDWEVDYPQAAPPNHNLLEYLQELNKEITRGIGVPDEVLSSDGTGALAGRRVPERGFYTSLEDDLFEVLDCIKQQTIEPGVWMNFAGRADTSFEILSAQLQPTEQAPDPTQPGQGQQPGGPPADPAESPNAPPSKPTNQDVYDQVNAPGARNDLMTPKRVAMSLRRNEACLLYGEHVVTPSRRRNRSRVSLSLVRSIGRPVATEDDIAEQVATVAIAYGEKLKRQTLRKLRLAIANYGGDPVTLGKRLKRILVKAETKYANAITQAIVSAYVHGAAKAAQTLPVPTSSQDVPGEAAPPPPAPFNPFGVIPPAGGEPPNLLGDVFGEMDDPSIRFPSIETAVDKIRAKIPLSIDEFAALRDAAKTEAFSVAGDHTEHAIVQIQEALADTVERGASMEDFRRDLVSRLGENPLSPWHTETVFRTNVMSAFHSGEQDVYQHPLIQGQFPYIAYDGIADTRIRDTHLAMMHYGCPLEDGSLSNIYRADDPIWEIWMPPNGYQCRCGVRYLTVQQAARLGVKEAIDWLASGTAPANPYRASLPPWLVPDPGFATRPSVGPPNFVRLSVGLGKRFKRFRLSDDPAAHWITLNADTGHGTHVQVDGGGTILKGPPGLQGHPIPSKSERRPSPAAKKIRGKTPASVLSALPGQDDGGELQLRGPRNKSAKKMNSGKHLQKALAFNYENKGPGVMKMSDLHVDPTRFQYKLNTDNPHGVTDQFADIEKFEPDFLGTIHVWTDPDDGKTYVVNGHHRRELAKRFNYTGDVAVHHLNEPSAKMARARGALINIASGHGTAIDAAKFMRDTGSSADDFKKHGLSLKGKIAGDATHLAALSPRLFDKLTAGDYHETRAVAIAKHVANHDDQNLLDRKIDEWEDRHGAKINDSTVEQMAKKMKVAAKQNQTVKNLFGEEDEEQNLFVEQADIEAGIRRELTARLNAFKAVSTDKKAGTLSDKGNVIKASDNKAEADRMANLLDDFDRESYYTGPITEALQDAAKQLSAKPAKRKQIIEETMSKILPVLTGGKA